MNFYAIIAQDFRSYKKKGTYFMDSESFQTPIHYTMAFIGGFLGAYSILNYSDLFAAAQTANMIGIITTLIGGNIRDFLLRAIALLVYASAIALSVIIPKYTNIRMRRATLLIEAITVTAVSFFPKEMNRFAATYPLFFILALQWCVFGGAKGYNCSCIFSTNNLKQTVLAMTQYLCTKDAAQAEKAKFFGTTLVCFHAGAAVSYAAYISFGLHASLLCLLPIFVCFSLVVLSENIIWTSSSKKTSSKPSSLRTVKA